MRGQPLGEAISQAGLNEIGVAWLPEGVGFLCNRHPADERYNKRTAFPHTLRGGCFLRAKGGSAE